MTQFEKCPLVAKQKCFSIELTIVDDGSPQKTFGSNLNPKVLQCCNRQSKK
jgi:hypothetical protein